jgi:23S rRNA pseudouridine1911/1915/1917 synthase
MSEPLKITVELADRADKALARQFPDAGRNQLSGLFADGCVKLGNRVLRKGDRVSPGEIIELSRLPVSRDALHPVADPDAAAKITILLERADIVAIAKPAGIPSQPLKAGELGTVSNALAHRFPECAAIGDDPRDGGLAHRLDIGTSGVLIAARTAEAYRALRDAFGGGLVSKTYLAIVEGRPVSRECDAPLTQRGKRVVVDHTDGLAAYTQFEVVSASATHALVRCNAQTGRMHQVRAHLAHVGSPLTGDTLYGGTGEGGFYLHAAAIKIPKAPALLDAIAVDAPIPDRFTAALATFGLQASRPIA